MTKLNRFQSEAYKATRRDVASREQLIDALRLMVRLASLPKGRGKHRQTCCVCDEPTTKWLNVEGEPTCEDCCREYAGNVLTFAEPPLQ